jgi:hypothetical protein
MVKLVTLVTGVTGEKDRDCASSFIFMAFFHHARHSRVGSRMVNVRARRWIPSSAYDILKAADKTKDFSEEIRSG